MKSTVYVCRTNQEALLTAFNLDISEDQDTIHPKHFCNTKMQQYCKKSEMKSKMVVTVWEPHVPEGCRLCDLFEQRGCPRRSSKDETHMMETLNTARDTEKTRVQ